MLLDGNCKLDTEKDALSGMERLEKGVYDPSHEDDVINSLMSLFLIPVIRLTDLV